MKRKTKITISIIILIIASYTIGTGIGYYIYKAKFQKSEFFEQIQKTDDLEKLILKSNLEEVSSSEPKVREDTKIVYEYFYKQDGFTEMLEDLPPYYAVGMKRAEFEEAFSDWSLKSFSSRQIILQKVIDAAGNKTYFINEHNGVIGVFMKNEDGTKRLIQTINKPIVSLDEEEQERIKNGVYVKGDAELAKYIEDYET